MAKEDTLLDKCVREALRLGFGPHVQHFADYAREKCGSLEAYFRVYEAPPKKQYSSASQEQVVFAILDERKERIRRRKVKPCKRCGRSVPPDSVYASFCSVDCFRRWDRDRQRTARRKAATINSPARPCEWCGKTIPAGTHPAKRFCCADCRRQATNARYRESGKYKKS